MSEHQSKVDQRAYMMVVNIICEAIDGVGLSGAILKIATVVRKKIYL